MDKASQAELLKFVLESIGLIRERFEVIGNSDDFLESKEGLTQLDAISCDTIDWRGRQNHR